MNAPAPAGSTTATGRDFEELWQNAPSAHLLLGDDGLVQAVNATFTAWTGHTPAAALGTPFAQLLPAGDRILWTTRCVAQLTATGRVAEVSVQVRGADGARHPVLMSASRVTTAAGPEVRITLVDAQQRRRYEQELLSARRSAEERAAQIAEAEAGLQALVHRDSLTGLLNRPGLRRALNTRLTAPGGTGPDDAVPTVLFIDLDGFKTVNDDLGHAVGDQLLQVLGARLTAAARAGAAVARFAGDEFVVLDDLPPSAAPAVAERLLAALAEPVELAGVEVVPTASIGIAAALPGAPDEAGATAELLLRRADTAMYRAKAQGRGRWAAHQPGDSDPATDRLTLLEQLRVALRDGELRVHYQPRVHAATGRTAGVEALVRWQHPTRGLLPPSAFIDAAEDSGLIRELGAWVLQEAVEQVVRWDRAGGDAAGLHVSVNLSARQLAETGLADRVAGVLARAGLPAARLVLEITETALMSSPELALRTLEQLGAVGVDLAVDDFGTGYSSFTYLKQFPVDELKIDRSFVAGLTTGVGDRAIVASCVHLAHAMGMIAVAEGVETAEQRDALVELGCDQLQGYLFDRPQPADVLFPPLPVGVA
ncbi:EAL domain-containing protein [Modestobacter sp. I12A-02628]|uniref:EAL domain-containing protein n=1 Tax=Goekera deserti TaxID=2497753 RepID=A0A7K3WCN9_9ACTN|nr:GGDEF domain-containing phosphodiesterase [Goekera deserti]MPQ98517.1 EAL domain-containing protein [Goekera deserti]NDI48347.1 EAL domain-containing protein [Goekera deserti]NEL54096.1 EAL domain-containing protein [Goekera deserti]